MLQPLHGVPFHDELFSCRQEGFGPHLHGKFSLLASKMPAGYGLCVLAARLTC